MNILFFGYSTSKNAGGAERYCYNILRALAERKHKIYVYVLHDSEEDPDFVYVNRRVPRNRYIDKFFLGRRVQSFLKSEGITIDIFINGHIFLYEKCEMIASRIGVNYDLFVYGIDCWGNRFRERMPRMTHLKQVVSISSFTTEQVTKQGYTGNVVYFPPLLDKATVQSSEKIATNPVNTTGKMILLTVARLDAQEQYKGHDAVLRALAIVRQTLPALEYWIVGRGNDMNRLKQLADEVKVADMVKFWGFVSEYELRDIYSQSDIFIMPSRVSLDPNRLEGEGFGIVFTEAALYEKALIGPNTGGSMDIIDNGVNGVTCDPEDIQDIARTIIKLSNDPELRRQMGKRAKQKTLSQFTVNQFDQYFKQLL
jgi:phosphatidyl-myo-inositol dimannoside synthase